MRRSPAKSEELESAILTALVRAGGSDYGLSLMKSVNEAHGTAVRATSLYRVLHRMEVDGLVEGAWESEEDRSARAGQSGPPRRYYRLTGAVAEQGRDAQPRLERGWAT